MKSLKTTLQPSESKRNDKDEPTKRKRNYKNSN